MPSPNSSKLHISETTCIPVSGPLAHAGAIAYLAVLAYPSRAEWPKRDKFVSGMKSWMFWNCVKRGYPKNQIKAEYRDEWRKKGGPRKFDAVANRAFDRILTRRLPAAQMLIWNLFHGFQIKLQFDSPEGVRLKNLVLKLRYNGLPDLEGERFNVDKAAKHLAGMCDPANIHRLIWRESLPVLHLAMVLGTEMHRVKNGSPDRLKLHPLDYLVVDPSWLPRTLRQAEMLRLFITPCLPKGRRELVQLLPTP